MMLTDNVSQGPGRFDIFDDFVTVLGMSLDQGEFQIIQHRRFAKNLRRDGNFPDIMDGSGHPNRFDFFTGEIHFRSDGPGQIGNPSLMTRHVRILRFRCGSQNIDGDFDGLTQAFQRFS